MILDPETNKYIHFGEWSFEDYTKHKDKKRRDEFLKRNHKWKNYPNIVRHILLIIYYGNLIKII